MWYISVALLAPMDLVTIDHLYDKRADVDGAWIIVVIKVSRLLSLVSKITHGSTVLWEYVTKLIFFY